MGDAIWATLEKLQHEIRALESELFTTKKQLQDALDRLAKAGAGEEDLGLQSEHHDEEFHISRQASRETVEAATQTDPVTFADDVHQGRDGATDNTQQSAPGESLEETSSEVKVEPLSIADSLKEAAEEALQQSGVVYDEKSGMYYDYNSGYYYDAERALYYEPSTGTYYSYDEETQSHKVHSRVDLTQSTNQHLQGNHEKQSKTERKRSQKKKSKDESEESRHDRKHVKRKKNGRESSSHHRRKKRKSDESESEDHDEENDRHKKKNHKRHKTEKKKLKKEKRLRRSRLREKSSETTSSDEDEKNGEDEKMKDLDVPVEQEIIGGKSQDSSSNDLLLPQEGSTEPQGRPSEETGVTTINHQLSSKEGQISCSKEKVVVKDKTQNRREEDSIYSNTGSESEFEEGELSDTSSGSSHSSADTSAEPLEKEAVKVVEETSARYYPPCIRTMVVESDHLDVGTLFVVTVTGASIGREKNLGHVIEVPDVQISKMHADIRYNEELRKYVLKDHASQNGTFLNGARISEPKVMSEPKPLSHMDRVQVGGTVLELHIHSGTDTCDGCEPGQFVAQKRDKPEKEIVVLTKAQKEKQRRQAMKMIKCKYGLKDMGYVDNKGAVSNPRYEDKAESRRRTVGSDHPYQKDDEPSSVDRAISEENKGHKMLQKLGWKEGESLGKSRPGIQEPIKIKFRLNQQAGLGSGVAHPVSLDDVAEAAASEKWVKAQKRFQQIPAPVESRKDSTSSKEKTFIQGPTINTSEDPS